MRLLLTGVVLPQAGGLDPPELALAPPHIKIPGMLYWFDGRLSYASTPWLLGLSGCPTCLILMPLGAAECLARGLCKQRALLLQMLVVIERV